MEEYVAKIMPGLFVSDPIETSIEKDKNGRVLEVVQYGKVSTFYILETFYTYWQSKSLEKIKKEFENLVENHKQINEEIKND